VDSGPGSGDPGSATIAEFPRADATSGHGAKCNVHNLWINLLIIVWGREVNG
jgi:hypothetical protein